MKKLLLSSLIATALSVPSLTHAEQVRVLVTVENLSPNLGTAQTPHWIGFHDGVFDIYNGGTAASFLPINGSVAVERLAEDGNTVPLSEDFQNLVVNGVDSVVTGPIIGPIRSGETGSTAVIVDSDEPNNRFFSYASMVLPSNDFWYANGNPQTHPVFDAAGNFIAEDFIVTQNDVLDAGTELNTEIPLETAFFGQQAPNTGQDENGVIRDFDPADPETFFLRPGSGGILDDARFAMADFLLEGYPLVKISFGSAPAIEGDLNFSANLDTGQEVPPSGSNATGTANYELREGGTVLSFSHQFRRLDRIVAAHLHLAPAGQNGPIVAFLLPGDFDPDSRDARRARRGFSGEIGNGDLVGPLAGDPLDALIAEINAGNVYINIHSEDFPGGAIRGQLTLN